MKTVGLIIMAARARKEEIILCAWILSLITLLITANLSLVIFLTICVIFFAISCYIIHNVADFERVYEKLID